MHRSNIRYGAAIIFMAAAIAQFHPARAAQAMDHSETGAAEQTNPGQIEAYQARFGRTRPLVAVVGENSMPDSSTEVTDFMIPYAVLTQSGAADTIALGTSAGPIAMRKALQVEPHATIAQFDERFPDGADYVLVPAVTQFEAPVLLDWIRAQAAKGATIVSICDGALVVAASGLMNGRRATAHWGTQELRFTRYPDIRWQKNVRYIADGKIVSSAGISAALPVSIALVEAIAGRGRAEALAAELGVADWSTRHNSDVFQPKPGVNLGAYLTSHVINSWLHRTDRIGVPIAAGVDDIALAFTADAYSRTGRSQAYSIAGSAAAVPTRNGLRIIPDRSSGTGELDFTLPAFAPGPGARALDRALADIALRYGPRTASGVALDFEYPGNSGN